MNQSISYMDLHHLEPFLARMTFGPDRVEPGLSLTVISSSLFSLERHLISQK